MGGTPGCEFTLAPIRNLHAASNSFLQAIDWLTPYVRLVYSPVWIQVEPTTRCNLHCLFCKGSVWDRRGIDMKFKDFRDIVNQIPSVSSIHLQGFGEPLMCRDFFPMVEYSKTRRIDVGTVTNGTLLSSKNNEKIINSGLDYILISVDGALPETFERIRVGCKFERVMQNVTELLTLREDRKKPVIGFLFVCTSQNLAELPAVVQLAGDMGVDLVQAQEALSFDDITIQTRLQKKEFHLKAKERKSIVDKASALARNSKISFYWAGGRRSFSPSRWLDWFNHDVKRCTKPFNSCYITADGYVTACCVNPDPRRHSFGNVLRTDFTEIWKSKVYMTMRSEFLRGKVPDYCLTCTVPALLPRPNRTHLLGC